LLPAARRSEILELNVWTTMVYSVLCAWVVLVLVTRNWWISTMVALIIVSIMTCVIATVFTIGYILDIFVSTFVALTIGLAIDYSVVSAIAACMLWPSLRCPPPRPRPPARSAAAHTPMKLI
jgi:predicted RND superfamily exporter protein